MRRNIEENKLPTADHVKLLGVEIGSKLTFNKEIEALCYKSIKSFSAFARVNDYICRAQALTVCNSLILFCNKGADKEIDRTHKRNSSVSLTEIYKSINRLNASLVWEFHEKKPITYSLRMQSLCKLPTIKSLGFGLDLLSFRVSFLWNTLDDSIKQEPTLLRFKKRMNEWTADRCTWKICR